MKRAFLALSVSLTVAVGAEAAPILDSVTTIASGAAVSATSPDSLSVSGSSLWVEYSNGADSTGAGGSSTIVQYNRFTGAIRSQYTISGNVDGLKVNPVTGQVWALQNQDGNATLSLIDPSTKTVSGPLQYGPPYSYGPNGGTGRGFDDVAFQNGKVFLSYTNPASASDPILVSLDQGNHPSGALTVTPVLLAGATGTLPDTDSLKSTPSGKLVLTAEGDGPGSGSTGEYTLISNAGQSNQSSKNVIINDANGNNVIGLDDVVFPGATSGTLYGYDSKTDSIYAFHLSGLNPADPIIAFGGFSNTNTPGGIAIVDPATGVATPFITGADIPGGASVGPGGLEFVPTPEPGAAALALTGAMIFGSTRLRRR